MTTFTAPIMSYSREIRKMLGYEPGITLSFETADLSQTLGAMHAAMWQGINEAEEIYLFLLDRNCGFDYDTIDFLLTAFEGPHPEHHLWSRAPCGSYMPIMGA